MINIEPKYLEIILNILQQYPYEFYVFGSRAKGTNQKFSDLDLCVKEYLSRREKATIMQDFDDSKLPITVDLIIWEECSNDFKNLIIKDMIQII